MTPLESGLLRAHWSATLVTFEAYWKRSCSGVPMNAGGPTFHRVTIAPNPSRRRRTGVGRGLVLYCMVLGRHSLCTARAEEALAPGCDIAPLLTSPGLGTGNRDLVLATTGLRDRLSCCVRFLFPGSTGVIAGLCDVLGAPFLRPRTSYVGENAPPQKNRKYLPPGKVVTATQGPGITGVRRSWSATAGQKEPSATCHVPLSTSLHLLTSPVLLVTAVGGRQSRPTISHREQQQQRQPFLHLHPASPYLYQVEEASTTLPQHSFTCLHSQQTHLACNRHRHLLSSDERFGISLTADHVLPIRNSRTFEPSPINSNRKSNDTSGSSEVAETSNRSGRPSARKWRPSRKPHKSWSDKSPDESRPVRADSKASTRVGTPESLVTVVTSSDPTLNSVSVVPTPTGVVGIVEKSTPSASPGRPKHIPILVPEYESLVQEYTQERPRLDSELLSPSSDSSSSTKTSKYPVTPPNQCGTLEDITKPRARHVEIQIPSWAQPVLKQPRDPPRVSLHSSIFFDPFCDVAELSPRSCSPPGGLPVAESVREQSGTKTMSRPTPESSRTNTMDSSISHLSEEHSILNHSATASTAHMLSANSSQSSLVGNHQNHDSASDVEIDGEEHGLGGVTPLQQEGIQSASSTTTPGAVTSTLSGLVCNVYRTTGREPHPLVGATTTILGDKLYVFGGRRLSRTKPQLTSNLYELDLIQRHWTKLDVSGDVPSPRYFHSICTLGDTKLVCYGGMSPLRSNSTESEVVVMSDVHMYDIPSRTWTQIATADAPQGRYAHCAAILPSSAVFTSPSAPISAMHHNPAGVQQNQGSLGISLDGTGGAEMVVVGGQDSTNRYIEQVSVFNFRSLKWTGTTGMGRSCGAYRSVVTPLATMNAAQIGAGSEGTTEEATAEEDADEIGSGAPMLIYSNYNFLDVKLELQVRLTDGTLTEKPLQTGISPPGLRFPNGGVIGNHFVVSGTFLTSSQHEYALWSLDLRTLIWSRIDAGGSIFSQGSWNRGVLWARRNSFIILGNRKRSLMDDYNNRRINFTNICTVELEAFGMYANPRRVEPSSSFTSFSADRSKAVSDVSASGRVLSDAAKELGALCLSVRELADMDFLAVDGTRIPVNSRVIARRWGSHFINLVKDSMASTSEDATSLRPGVIGNPSRNSSITITPSVTSQATTLNGQEATSIMDVRMASPSTRPRLLYLPHSAPTLQALLHYLYTSTLPSPPSALATPQIFCSLLQLARPYKVDGLLEVVVERLHESLDGRNAAAIFNAAAMGAGGGEGLAFDAPVFNSRESAIPPRTASLQNMGALTNGGIRGPASLRINTEMANSRETHNAIHPDGSTSTDTSDDDAPGSAHTDGSMSDIEHRLNSARLTHDRHHEVWGGGLSAVVGLQKRGLRGLMEGRRLREREHEEEIPQVGLGIV
nr:protein ral2 [Quercus suber]